MPVMSASWKASVPMRSLRTCQVMATSGPGATNLITGIANAYLDSVPLVAITWQVRSDLIGTDAFQEADMTGITLPIVKHSYLVKDAADLPRVAHEAFHIASTGRPGPVVIDIPVDAALSDCVYQRQVSIVLPGYKPTVKGHIKQIRAAAKAINEAQRPVLYLGGGADLLDVTLDGGLVAGQVDAHLALVDAVAQRRIDGDVDDHRAGTSRGGDVERLVSHPRQVGRVLDQI